MTQIEIYLDEHAFPSRSLLLDRGGGVYPLGEERQRGTNAGAGSLKTNKNKEGYKGREETANASRQTTTKIDRRRFDWCKNKKEKEVRGASAPSERKGGGG